MGRAEMSAIGRLAWPLVFLVGGCSADHRTAAVDLLQNCWGARAVGPDTFELSFTALDMRGTEGGIYSRSSQCRNARLFFAEISDAARERIDPLNVASEPGTSPFKGIAGRALVSPLERDGEYVAVVLKSLPSFRRLSPAETSQYMREFDIR